MEMSEFLNRAPAEETPAAEELDVQKAVVESLAADKAPEKVYLAPSGEEIPFSYENGRVEISVPSVLLHQMVVVE